MAHTIFAQKIIETSSSPLHINRQTIIVYHYSSCFICDYIVRVHLQVKVLDVDTSVKQNIFVEIIFINDCSKGFAYLVPHLLLGSVADPDPGPKDPHHFAGSGSPPPAQ